MIRIRWPVCSMALLVAGLLAAPGVHAADVSLSAGRTSTSAHRWANAAFLDVTTATHSWGRLHVQPTVSLGWIGARSMQKEHLNHAVVVGAAGLRLVDWWRGAFASFEIGVAGGRTAAISSAGQFVSTVGWQGRHWQVMVRHISNGDLLGGKNLGETMLLAGVRF